jgi:hypothetical protein
VLATLSTSPSHRRRLHVAFSFPSLHVYRMNDARATSISAALDADLRGHARARLFALFTVIAPAAVPHATQSSLYSSSPETEANAESDKR